MAELLPVFLKLEGRSVLIVGGGEVALAKARALLPCGPRIVVVAPCVNPGLAELARSGRIELVERPFVEADLDRRHLVFAATDDPALNRSVAEWAARRGILVNAVDDSGCGDFFSASVVRRGPFTLAIGTAGGFPGLTRALREALERWLPPGLAEAGAELSRLRARVRAAPLERAHRAEALAQLRAWFAREYLAEQEPP
jgi:siroheme synthase-like protein